MRIALGLCAALVIGSPTASAQTLAQTGQPNGSASTALEVMSTNPVLYSCGWSPGASCFRVYFEMRAKDEDGTVFVARLPRSGHYETIAFAGTGANCTALEINGGSGGLPEATVLTSGTILWSGEPYDVTSSKPATYMVQFSCDGRLVPGDQVTVNLVLAADPTGRGPKLARYVFPRLTLQAGA